MQKDIALKQLAEYNDVFAEIFNVLACDGQPVLDAEELTSIPTEAVTEEQEGDLQEKRRDVVKADKRGGQYRLIFDLENQSDIDNTMPERVMGYDYASYEKQIREIMEENRKNKNPAVTKRIHRHQKLAPVLTVVLYWGDDTWDSPRCLHDMLEFPAEAEHVIRPLIPNYPINLVCMKTLPEEVRQQLHTDIRLLAEYAACKEDVQKCKRVFKDTKHVIHHPKEFFRALSVIAGERRFREIVGPLRKKLTEEKEETTMCEALDELLNESRQEGRQEGLQEGRQEGRQEGLQEGIAALIEVCKEFGIRQQETVMRIMSKFTMSQQEAENYVARCW